ncbi:hypothetical protein LXA43DRAFT_191334 [Ganoderma leucocontextum]|nr:hypothetical protein LXA43DRAFT_191334 [Ganoderma leucocontextum]
MSDSWNDIFQNCWYVGDNFNSILYGVELVMYFITVKLVLNARKRRRLAGGIGNRASHRLFLFLSTGLLCMITIYLFAQNFFGEEMWIIHSGYSGGSGQYYADHAAVWYQTLGSAASVVMNWMSDAFLIYRVYTVWEKNVFVIIIPSILYVGTIVLGVLTCYYSGRPGGDFFVGIAPRIALAYSAVGIGMNVICSSLICGFIIYRTHKFSKILARNDDDEHSISDRVVSIFVESMLPYTLFGVAYVTTLGLNSPTSILFLSLYIMFTCLSPQMIMLRVLLGRGWRNERTLTAGQNSSLKFAPGRAKSQLAQGTARYRETVALPDLSIHENASRSLTDTHGCTRLEDYA